jgi:cytochrome o ubiquinol oxidase subunit II
MPRLLLICISCCLLCACDRRIVAPAGPVAGAERLILFNSLAIMLTVVIPTIVAILLFAWRYRASNTKARYLPDWAYSGRLELITWSIPTLIILFLSGVIWTGSHDLDPARSRGDRALEVQVVSLDWKWLFIYPDQHVASVNQLVLPAGVPVHFSLTSASVMNQFFVPQLGGMIATMNRMVTHLNLQADRTGTFYGQSAQFSGDGFSDMHFAVRAVSAQEFSSWVAATQREGPALDRASYTTLAAQSRDVAPFTYRSADRDLFAAIVSRSLPPGPGPRPEPIEQAHDLH